MPGKSKPPFRAKRNARGHETPRIILPALTPRAAAARERALAFLAVGGLSPFPDFKNVRNSGRGFWSGH